jgi:hypothetical protein
MTNRAPAKVIRNLEEALRVAKMERASFGFDNERLRIVTGFDEGHEESIDSYIKERTRLYRESWLIPQIEEALAWARGEP